MSQGSGAWCNMFADVWALALLSGDVALLTLLKAPDNPKTFWDRLAAHWQDACGMQMGGRAPLKARATYLASEACGMHMGGRAPQKARAILRAGMRGDSQEVLGRMLGMECSEAGIDAKSFSPAFPQAWRFLMGGVGRRSKKLLGSRRTLGGRLLVQAAGDEDDPIYLQLTASSIDLAKSLLLIASNASASTHAPHPLHAPEPTAAPLPSATPQVPVSAYVGSSKKLKDLKDFSPEKRAATSDTPAAAPLPSATLHTSPEKRVTAIPSATPHVSPEKRVAASDAPTASPGHRAASASPRPSLPHANATIFSPAASPRAPQQGHEQSPRVKAPAEAMVPAAAGSAIPAWVAGGGVRSG
ncbi:hypothetical protein T484DRAFT_1878140, partial [Baffinella frigidus]